MKKALGGDHFFYFYFLGSSFKGDDDIRIGVGELGGP